MFSSRGTVRYEERGQGYRDVEKVGKQWPRWKSPFPPQKEPPTKQEAERPSQPVWMLLGKEKIRLPPPKDEPRLLGLPSPSLTITAFWSVFDSLHNATDLYIGGVISLIQMF